MMMTTTTADDEDDDGGKARMTRAEETTTERRVPARPLARLSVRTRITAVIAILATAAMAGAGVLVYTLESARIERQTNAQIDQEIAEFRQLQGGNDPDTAEPFTSVKELLNTFIARNVPDDDEILVGYAGAAEEAIRTPNRNAEKFLGEPCLPAGRRRADRVRRHREARHRRVRRRLGHRDPGEQPAHPRGAGHRELPA